MFQARIFLIFCGQWLLSGKVLYGILTYFVDYIYSFSVTNKLYFQSLEISQIANNTGKQNILSWLQ